MLAVLFGLGLAGFAVSALIDGSDDDDSSSSSETYGLDVQTGTSSADALNGTSDTDWIKGEGGEDTISGGAGADVLQGGGAKDLIYGGGGNDLIEGGYWADTISGGNGDDAVIGGNGQDVLKGDGGNDALLGGAGNDRLEGGDGNDVLNGGFENQAADGSGTDLTAEFTLALTQVVLNAPELLDGSQEDLFNSSYFENVDIEAMQKGPGSDGADTLNGGAGNDTLYLAGGDSGFGDDGFFGETGNDTFVLNDKFAGSAAVIEDFGRGNDVIEIEYDPAQGVPTVTIESHDLDDRAIYVDGEILAVVVDGGVTLSDIRLSAVTVENIVYQ